jgi:hypothetical protein
VAAFLFPSEINATKSKLADLYNFLDDFKNFESILPSDKIEGFRYTAHECSFSIRGITALTIRQQDKKPYEFITFKSEGLAKFNFILRVNFIGDGDDTGKCQVELSGDMNPFIRSMAEKPLTELINTMSLRLSQL